MIKLIISSPSEIFHMSFYEMYLKLALDFSELRHYSSPYLSNFIQKLNLPEIKDPKTQEKQPLTEQ